MLRQLSQLSIDTDGRYASATELQFLKDYLKSADQRITAYEKIRDAADQIIDQVEAAACEIEPNVFHQGPRDLTAMFRRDRKHNLRFSSASMLFNDLERLRDSLLIWKRTIISAVKQEHASQIVCQVLSGIVKQHLTPEEAALMMPSLQLDKTFLG